MRTSSRSLSACFLTNAIKPNTLDQLDVTHVRLATSSHQNE